MIFKKKKDLLINGQRDLKSGGRAAIFLDRDGTLIEDVGLLKTPADIRLYPDTIKTLQKLQPEFQFFVITNQAGIAQGFLTMDQVIAVNEALSEMLLKEGVVIQAWYVCPHHRHDNCVCIKPKPEFALRAAHAYGLDLHKSFSIGDHPHDTLMANEYGVVGLYLLTGHGGKHLTELPADKLVFHCLSDAADWIVTELKSKIILQQQIEDRRVGI